MKVLVEVIIISFLIIIGWRQPFREHAARIMSPQRAVQWGIVPKDGVIPRPRAVRAPTATPPPATPRDVSWMWGRKPLDAPEP
jgi:hypothetical protein